MWLIDERVETMNAQLEVDAIDVLEGRGQINETGYEDRGGGDGQQQDLERLRHEGSASRFRQLRRKDTNNLWRRLGDSALHNVEVAAPVYPILPIKPYRFDNRANFAPLDPQMDTRTADAVPGTQPDDGSKLRQGFSGGGRYRTRTYDLVRVKHAL
jgi:hypothetical protein